MSSFCRIFRIWSTKVIGNQRYNSEMSRIIAVLVCMAIPAFAQDWARQRLEQSPRHREWVTVKHDGRSVETFIAYPESKAKTPVILVIHEILA